MIVNLIVFKSSTVLLQARYGCVPTAVFLHMFFLRLLIRSLGHFPKTKRFPCSTCQLMSYCSIWLLVATGIMQNLQCHGPHHITHMYIYIYTHNIRINSLNWWSAWIPPPNFSANHARRYNTVLDSVMLAQISETEGSTVNGSKQSAMFTYFCGHKLCTAEAGFDEERWVM